MASTAPPSLEDEANETCTENDNTLITIHVGTGPPRTFHLRKSLLTSSSGYFAAALSGRFLEAEENVCRLPEEDPLVFQMFAHWVEHGTLYESTLGPEVLLSYRIIAQLYVFADAHAVPALENTALDIFAGKVSFTKEPVTRDCGQYILDHTLESSPLRGLVMEIVQQAVRGQVRPRTFEEVVELLPGGDAAPAATAAFARGGPMLVWRSVGISSCYLRKSYVSEEGYKRR